MRLISSLPLFVLLCFAPQATISAQTKGPELSPAQKKIKKLVMDASKTLRKIDLLLLDTDTESKQKRQTSGQQLEAIKQKQQEVIEAIEKIIKNLPKNDKKGGQGNPSKKPKQDHKKQDQDKKKREQQKTPDVKKKDKEQKGKQKPEKGGKPKDKKDKDSAKGKNKKMGKSEQFPTGQTPDQTGKENWGNLPAWVRKFFKKGEVPKIPEKYRRLWEKFQKRNRQKR